MRLRIEPDPVASLQSDGFQHRACGALTVGASNNDERDAERKAESIPDGSNPLKRHLNFTGMQQLATRQPGSERCWKGRHHQLAARQAMSEQSPLRSRHRIGALTLQYGDGVRDGSLEFASIDDHVDRPGLHQKLCALKALR